MEHSLFIDVIILFFASLGFTLASHIYRKKRAKQPLVCPLRSRCDLVTTSHYSKFLGVPVEILGMLYYAVVIVFHILAIAYPFIFSVPVVRLSLGISSFAFLFSLYLIAVQAFILKEWCTWCLCSAVLCAAIFATTYLAVPISIF